MDEDDDDLDDNRHFYDGPEDGLAPCKECAEAYQTADGRHDYGKVWWFEGTQIKLRPYIQIDYDNEVAALTEGQALITVYGASDDLIEVEGDITEEFTYHDDEDGDLIAFSDGTVLRVRFDRDGVWRITPVARGANQLDITQAPVNDDDNYSDRAVIVGTVTWVVQGMAVATHK